MGSRARFAGYRFEDDQYLERYRGHLRLFDSGRCDLDADHCRYLNSHLDVYFYLDPRG